VQSGACWKKEAGGGQAAAAGRQAGNALFVICIACLRCEKKSSKLIVFFFQTICIPTSRDSSNCCKKTVQISLILFHNDISSI
jgi:hypothetical protein